MSTTGGVSRPSISVLPYDTRAAEWHAAERTRLTAAGKTPPFANGRVAAIASTNDLIVVTSNVTDLAHFDDTRVEDWRRQT